MTIGDVRFKQFDDARREYRRFRETKARQCGPFGLCRTSKTVSHIAITVYMLEVSSMTRKCANYGLRQAFVYRLKCTPAFNAYHRLCSTRRTLRLIVSGSDEAFPKSSTIRFWPAITDVKAPPEAILWHILYRDISILYERITKFPRSDYKCQLDSGLTCTMLDTMQSVQPFFYRTKALTVLSSRASTFYSWALKSTSQFVRNSETERQGCQASSEAKCSMPDNLYTQPRVHMFQGQLIGIFF